MWGWRGVGVVASYPGFCVWAWERGYGGGGVRRCVRVDDVCVCVCVCVWGGGGGGGEG